jgi:hypothetical protein
MDKSPVIPQKKEEPNEPWRPAALLITPQEAGKRRRWVRLDLLDRKKLEGWTPVEAKDETEKTIIDGTQAHSYVKKRNLILCEMPEGKAKQRDAYFKNKTDLSEKDAVATFKGKFSKGETYGDITKEDI